MKKGNSSGLSGRSLGSWKLYSDLSVQQHTMSCSLIPSPMHTAFISSHNAQVFAVNTGTLCETTEAYSMLKPWFGLQETITSNRALKHTKIDGIGP